MVSAPFISFIIASFDTPQDMLRECIGSLLSLPLSKGEREIIVVDDGSHVPVSTLLDMEEMEVRVIRLPENRGQSSARNEGLRVAQGEYVQFVDSDDCLIGEGEAHCLELLRTS